MKKLIYILAALLSFLGLLCFVLILFPELINMYEDFADLGGRILYEMTNNIFDACACFVLGILCLMQLKKSTPRLLMFFCGISFFGSFRLILFYNWWGLLLFTAGLLPAVYEFIKYGKKVKEAPLQPQRYNGLLIAAAVLACICIVSGIGSTISSGLFNIELRSFPPIYYLGIIGVAHSVCTAVYCFLRTRRTSVLYRMFLIGPYALAAFLFPMKIITALPVFFRDETGINVSVVSIILVLLVLIHAFKTRHDSIIPQEHIEVVPQTGTPVS